MRDLNSNMVSKPPFNQKNSKVDDPHVPHLRLNAGDLFSNLNNENRGVDDVKSPNNNGGGEYSEFNPAQILQNMRQTENYSDSSSRNRSRG